MTDIARLFSPEPARWGLRGDPDLWRELQAHFAGVPLPGATDDLIAMIHAAFLDCTGFPVTHPDHILVPRFRRGGMSSGMVSPTFWTTTAIPLLCKRLRAAQWPSVDLPDRQQPPMQQREEF